MTQWNVLIYNDAGASADSVNELLRFFEQAHIRAQTATGADLQNTRWQDQTELLIIPGGRSLPFYETLGEQGNQRIIDFVARGGKYLGICAGAYYACSETIFAKGLSHELILPGKLHFFESRAIGPVFAAEEFAYQSEQGARVVNITLKDSVYPVYFNGGCYFENAQTRVVANYTDNGLPAIIQCPFGKGQVTLSGVHPELSYRTIPKDNHPHHISLREALQSVDLKRENLMGILLGMIKG